MRREWAPPALACRRATVQEGPGALAVVGKRDTGRGNNFLYREGALTPLGQAGVLHRILIPDSLLIVLPVVSSAVFLSVGPSLIAVGFGSSFQLLSRDISFRPNGGGRRLLEEGEDGEGRRRSGKARVADQTAGTTGTGFHALRYLSVGSTRARRSDCAGGSPKIA
jgi:hypothetical protein